MVRLLGAWCAALIVWLLGFAIVARLVSRAEGGTLSDFDRMVRLDLPWVAISILMVVVAGLVNRDRTRPVHWFAAVLAIPLLAIVPGLVFPFAGGGDVLSAVLYVAEGAAGAAVGLAVAALVSVKRERHGGYW